MSLTVIRTTSVYRGCADAPFLPCHAEVSVPLRAMLEAFYEFPSPVLEAKITPRIIRDRLNPVQEALRM